ncbi:hypothetical protein [Stenotrophomonas oahuensis]|uniref:Uncharacterized protein n=1 Tax=Stenotrophomonas oahuensis TaxID=3003271 RepID=A0ABY9YQD1_9GAMM|nr:hypothetical protein [Stenotrophomonas sp. A5586]WNH52418.1 hypothetical protein PDM29_19180 [Stenotrophomonas sp. A5586]
MSSFVVVPLAIAAVFARFIYVAKKDQRLLKVFAGAVKGCGDDALHFALERATRFPKSPLETSEWKVLQEAVTPLYVERTMAQYGDPLATYDALCRLRARMHKVQLKVQ